VLLDKELSGYELTIYKKLFKEKLPVRFVHMPSKNVMHSKVIIIDGEKVEVGSINFSESALKGNREAGIIISSRAIASRFSEAFESDWQNSKDYYVTDA